MTSLAEALQRSERLSADLEQLLERARTAQGAARDRALTAAIAINDQLGEALAEVGQLLDATRIAIAVRELGAPMVLH